MSEIVNADPTPEFFQYAVTAAFQGASLQLGIIPSGTNLNGELHLTDRAAVIAAEYNGAGWVRPSINVPAVGAYNSSDRDWELPSMEIPLVAPGEGLAFEQFFLMLGSTTAPQDASGTLITLYTMASTVTLAAGQNFSITLPWELFADATV